MLNKSIESIPLPPRMARLPIDARGYPVPWFVAQINGEWDFRAFGHEKITRAIREKLCWLCGQRLGQYQAFVIGPMCSITRTSNEPPSHRDCAEYAVRACPFLSKPRMRRNENDLPEGTAAGIALEHNPGATLIWITKSYRLFFANGPLFEIGPPLEVYWYCEGRTATRDEIMASFNKGLPHLRALAEQEPGGKTELERQYREALRLVEATQ